jgi:hypothetical protein
MINIMCTLRRTFTVIRVRKRRIIEERGRNRALSLNFESSRVFVLVSVKSKQSTRGNKTAQPARYNSTDMSMLVLRGQARRTIWRAAGAGVPKREGVHICSGWKLLVLYGWMPFNLIPRSRSAALVLQVGRLGFHTRIARPGNPTYCRSLVMRSSAL